MAADDDAVEERDPPVYVAVTFRLEETVTPVLFAQRVAQACVTFGAIRPGEAVVVPDGSGCEYVAVPKADAAHPGRRS